MRDAIISFPMLGDGFFASPSATYTLFGRTFYWYGAITALGFLCAIVFASRVCKKRFGIKSDDMVDVLLLAVPMTIVGCRLYYVAVHFDEFRDDLIGILRIWEGGLAIYGGLLFAFLSVWFMCRRKKISTLAFLDLTSVSLLMGQFIGRWSNFINREAYGVETEIFCRMGLTLNGSTIYVHPLFLYESLWNLLGFIILCCFMKRRRYDGQLFLMYIGWYGVIRAINDGIRLQNALFFPGTTIPSSQVIGALTALAAIVLLVVLSRREHPPERLWVNRAAAAEKAAEAPPEDS